VNLRPARPDDAERLFAWRNDPTTRRFAFDPDELSWDAHVAWLGRRLTDPDTAILIAEDEGEPVGQIRFDRSGDAAVIDVAVAPEARGRGLGTSLIRAGATSCPLPVTTLRAQVVPANGASLTAFRRAGFRDVAEDDRAVTLERPVDARGST
jgi:RimJ/RimL family protein N-acetyltransferase